MNRNKISFEEYEVMGYDADWDTWGFHGTEVLEDGHHIGIVPWLKPSDLEEMDDDELEEIFAEHGIFTSLA